MKRTACLILSLLILLSILSACGEKSSPEAEDITVRLGFLAGPTSMGAIKLLDDSDKGLASQKYEYSIKAEASAFAPALVKKEVDIAALPANLASVIYNNTQGGIKLLAINTLGVLYIVERGEQIKSFSDISGKTLLATGEGAVPEFALRYLLKQNGLEGEKAPKIKWCAEAAEALAYLEKDETAIAMLPQPYVTAAQMKIEGLRVALDLNKEWEKESGGLPMVTGVVCVRSDFAEEHPKAVAQFMKDYSDSVDFVKANTEAAAEMLGEHEIVKAPVAKKALPSCNITFIDSEDMAEILGAYLEILYAMNPQAVGGKLPDDGFYYTK